MKNLLYSTWLIITVTFSSAYAQFSTITAGTQGVIQLPKLSYEQINAIPNPKAGMMVFDSTFKCLKYYSGSKWLCSSQNENNASATGFAWKHINNSYQGSDFPLKIHVNQNNEVYMTGAQTNYYSTPVIAKYSASGNLLWKVQEPGLYNVTSGSSIKVDPSNNTYALFNWHWNGSTHPLVFKILPNGSSGFQRGLSAAPSGTVRGTDIFLDNSQNLYVTGTFNGTLENITSSNGSAFIAKYSSNGTLQWVKNIPSPVVAINSNNEFYFAGYFLENQLINGNPYYTYGGYDMIFGKLNQSGEIQWIKHIGGSGNDKITDAAIDTNGNLFVTGSFSNAVDFDGNMANSLNEEDFFVMKYSTDGVFQWIRNGGGTGKDEGAKLQITNGNHPVISGIAGSHSVAFYPNTTIYPSTSPSNFLIKYNGESGDIIWAKPNEISTNFKVKSDGNIYVWANIGNGSETSPTGGHVLAKYLQNGELVYRVVNDGRISDLNFGTNNHFFATGNFQNTVQIGVSKLTPTDIYGDIYISHWVD